MSPAYFVSSGAIVKNFSVVFLDNGIDGPKHVADIIRGSRIIPNLVYKVHFNSGIN
jgi:hypothetical protein